MYTGEYGQPLQRSFRVMFPAVSGYTTGRLRAVPGSQANLASATLNKVKAIVCNEGESAVQYQIVEADDVTVSGARTVVASSTVQPGGRVPHVFDSTKNFMEFRSVAGTSQIRLELESVRQFELRSFAKTEAIYPTSLWQGKLAS